MKRIAILTFTNGMNIGQRLQNYALQTLLEEEGFSPYTIKQRLSWSAFKLTLKQKITMLKNPRHCFLMSRKANLFRKFNQENMIFSQMKLSFSGKQRQRIASSFDGFIVGSDQIWNPNSPFVGENFFLDFVPREKRLTYAPSFSVEQIPDSIADLYSERLNRFDQLSVREHAGADIIQALTGHQATVVLDPTLLLHREHWNKLMVPCGLRPQKSYILTLFLGTLPNEDISKLKSMVDLPIIAINAESSVGPAEFLDLVSHASLVATDSYHITIFSIIYEKPFVNFQRRETTIDMNSRFRTLYSSLSITNRDWVYLQDNPQEIFNLDFDKVRESLCKERISSRAFLHDELIRLDADE